MSSLRKKASRTTGVVSLLSLLAISVGAAPSHALPACTPSTSLITGATVVSFTSVGSCDWVVPSDVTTLTQILIIGGGGGGGYDIGGGGGAGGVIELTNVTVTPGATLPVVVGAGGDGNTNYATNPASDGSDSSFLGNTARGGGAGGSGGETGKDGGSGGGAGYGAYGAKPGGASTQAAPGLGNAGGATTGGQSGAGGGGAGAAGSDADVGGNNQQGGDGGAGIASSITGTSRFYAGGGGGASQPAGSGTSGGSGVGGNGGRVAQGLVTAIVPGAGAANTGSGGGGGGSGADLSVKNGGAGGSGVVILRYASEGASEDPQEEAPPPDWFQSVARLHESDMCEEGWSASWAQWPHAGLGGWVCNRVIYWNSGIRVWMSRPA